MDRAAATLSGGEAQRIRLATQIGSALVGVLYVLDEPSIGLHQRDNSKLIATLERLRDVGNTVIVVEHDEQTMRAADYLVDLGPGAGEHGGEIVAQGTAKQVEKVKKSLTGQFLAGTRTIDVPRAAAHADRPRRDPRRAAAQPQVDRRRRAARRADDGDRACRGRASRRSSTRCCSRRSRTGCTARGRGRGRTRRCSGSTQLDKIIQVDQSPIGRTPRSNPATYTGLFDTIRDLFAKTQEARARGYKPGRFSFNVKGGRCEVCRGDGQIKIEMHFLPDVYVPCDQCHGKRYNKETLDIRFKGKNIAEILEMSVEEGVEFFQHIPKIRRRLSTLNDVGLGYIRLGQPATTLSGGEAQRVKLATELSKVATGRTLYILDEPTTGLHFADVRAAARRAAPAGRRGQLGRRDRAQPRRHQDRRPHHRHGPRGREEGGESRRGRGTPRRSPGRRARTPGRSCRAGHAGGADRAARRRATAEAGTQEAGRGGGLTRAERRRVTHGRPMCLRVREVARRPDARLDELALAMAAEFRPVEAAAALAALDALGAELRELVAVATGGRGRGARVRRAPRRPARLRGRPRALRRPDNSMLDRVLVRRRGLPILLWVVYWRVARRAGVALSGVGLPGHYVVGHFGAERPLLLDPFAGGEPLDVRTPDPLVRPWSPHKAPCGC